MKENRRHIQLFLAGDSTVASCPEYEAPMAGWGQVFQSFFSDEMIVHNKAMGGRSSNSFIEEGRLSDILEHIRQDDYLFIQFGHNDQKSYGTQPFSTYKSFLSQYITGAREVGAKPVLITPVHRRKFGEDGKLQNTLGEYPTAMTELAEQLGVPLIDLWSKTKVLYESMGLEVSKSLFVWFEAGEHPNYPQGIQDDTHFCELGAYKVGELVIEGIKELDLPLAVHITNK
jgi:lysophospholipase L1-like esterase